MNSLIGALRELADKLGSGTTLGDAMAFVESKKKEGRRGPKRKPSPGLFLFFAVEALRETKGRDRRKSIGQACEALGKKTGENRETVRRKYTAVVTAIKRGDPLEDAEFPQFVSTMGAMRVSLYRSLIAGKFPRIAIETAPRLELSPEQRSKVAQVRAALEDAFRQLGPLLKEEGHRTVESLSAHHTERN